MRSWPSSCSDGRNGASWSLPARVNDDATTTDQWQPAIAVTPGGNKLGIFYYSRQGDTAENNLYRLYGRTATISGGTVTFDASSAVSDIASLPEFGRDNLVNNLNMGDWLSAVATANAFHVAWGDARSDLPGGAPRKDPNIYYDRIPIGPEVISSAFLFETLPLQLRFDFTDDVGASLGLSDFEVRRSIDFSTFTPSSFAYNPAARTATLFFNSPLPEGNYVARAIASGITNSSGQPLLADGVLPFFVFSGDANRDRTVDIGDFAILAGRFNQAGTFTQGDFNYDGITDIGDFSILASRFNTSLPAARAALPNKAQSAVRAVEAPTFFAVNRIGESVLHDVELVS